MEILCRKKVKRMVDCWIRVVYEESMVSDVGRACLMKV